MWLCLLLLAVGALQLALSQTRLEGFTGESLSFPALRPVAPDIARIIWFSDSRGTHIAEAKPLSREFRTDYDPVLRPRLALHRGNLSLEITALQLSDSGVYRATVDIQSNPTRPQMFYYELIIQVHQLDPPGSTWPPPQGPTTPVGSRARTSTRDPGGTPRPGEDPGHDKSRCGACSCALKGYIIAAVYGTLLLTVAIVHIKTQS
ncbi:PREDICTED: uncharacterized protein LOC109297651 [Gavialis gangeticus]|uniref:uncharacterized protein LOC109297651 n=1 Tax=Gavialis gangeticus TaxID=94835 RepID=UPI00092F4FD9|nr:PREDICTED: uncharacterized protein LOC109297651 [Gavialis gangeticus]